MRNESNTLRESTCNFYDENRLITLNVCNAPKDIFVTLIFRAAYIGDNDPLVTHLREMMLLMGFAGITIFYEGDGNYHLSYKNIDRNTAGYILHWVTLAFPGIIDHKKDLEENHDIQWTDTLPFWIVREPGLGCEYQRSQADPQSALKMLSFVRNLENENIEVIFSCDSSLSSQVTKIFGLTGISFEHVELTENSTCFSVCDLTQAQTSNLFDLFIRLDSTLRLAPRAWLGRKAAIARSNEMKFNLCALSTAISYGRNRFFHAELFDRNLIRSTTNFLSPIAGQSIGDDIPILDDFASREDLEALEQVQKITLKKFYKQAEFFISDAAEHVYPDKVLEMCSHKLIERATEEGSAVFQKIVNNADRELQLIKKHKAIKENFPLILGYKKNLANTTGTIQDLKFHPGDHDKAVVLRQGVYATGYYKNFYDAFRNKKTGGFIAEDVVALQEIVRNILEYVELLQPMQAEGKLTNDYSQRAKLFKEVTEYNFQEDKTDNVAASDLDQNLILKNYCMGILGWSPKIQLSIPDQIIFLSEFLKLSNVVKEKQPTEQEMLDNFNALVTAHQQLKLLEEDQKFYELLNAAANGDLEKCRTILNSSVEIINQVDWDGRTALFYAVYYNHVELAVFLLERGADTDIVDKHGKKASDYNDHAQAENIVRLQH